MSFLRATIADARPSNYTPDVRRPSASTRPAAEPPADLAHAAEQPAPVAEQRFHTPVAPPDSDGIRQPDISADTGPPADNPPRVEAQESTAVGSTDDPGDRSDVSAPAADGDPDGEFDAPPPGAERPLSAMAIADKGYAVKPAADRPETEPAVAVTSVAGEDRSRSAVAETIAGDAEQGEVSSAPAAGAAENPADTVPVEREPPRMEARLPAETADVDRVIVAGSVAAEPGSAPAAELPASAETTAASHNRELAPQSAEPAESAPLPLTTFPGSEPRKAGADRREPAPAGTVEIAARPLPEPPRDSAADLQPVVDPVAVRGSSGSSSPAMEPPRQSDRRSAQPANRGRDPGGEKTVAGRPDSVPTRRAEVTATPAGDPAFDDAKPWARLSGETNSNAMDAKPAPPAGSDNPATPKRAAGGSAARGSNPAASQTATFMPAERRSMALGQRAVKPPQASAEQTRETPAVQIGQIDVIVEVPARPAARPAAAPASADLASRYYLRRL